MAQGDEWGLWHLTPRGWEGGSFSKDTAQKSVPDPADRVLTYKHRKWMDGLKNNSVSEEVWRSGDQAEIDRLLGLHGDCPETMP